MYTGTQEKERKSRHLKESLEVLRGRELPVRGNPVEEDLQLLAPLLLSPEYTEGERKGEGQAGVEVIFEVSRSKRIAGKNSLHRSSSYALGLQTCEYSRRGQQ